MCRFQISSNCLKILPKEEDLVIEFGLEKSVLVGPESTYCA